MQREIRGYLLDIIEACDAIAFATHNLNVDAYCENRLIRSSVEREFITIGEAVGAMSHLDPELFDRISQARRIVDFRNQLTHGYATVNDIVVWGIANRDVPLLRRECEALMSEIDAASEAD
jgi:uncharacterized protein with HEPN domain